MSGKAKRGFASMDPERQKEIASRGGRAAHEKGTAHEWSVDEARSAGRRGGVAVSRDREHMSAIGREGGEAKGRRVREMNMLGRTDRETALPVTREGSPLVATARARVPGTNSDALESRGTETRV